MAAFAVVSVNAATEAANAHLKLQNTFQNNEKLADSSVAAFERQADALRDLTGVDDEAIISSQALLGQFELTGKQVQTLTPLIVDLSEKMGIDLNAAAKAVGKATAGSAGILQRYGITVDETAFKADAYSATLEALGKVQGFAAQQAKIEPWRVLGAQFEEIAEDVGTALLPALRDIAGAFRDLLPVIAPVLRALGDLIALVGDAVAAIANLLTLDFASLDSGIVEHAAQMERLFQMYDQGKISIIELENELLKLREETGITSEVNEAYSRALAQARDATDRAKQASMEWKTILAAQEDATADTTSSTRELTDAQRELRLATLAATNSFFGILDSADQVTAAQRKLNQMQENGKTGTKAYEQAVRDALTAQLGLEDAVLSYAQELIDSGQKQKDVESKVRDLARQFGLQGSEVQSLLDRVRGYVSELNRIPSRVDTVITTTHVDAREGPGLQHGGIVTQTGLAVVHRGEVFSGVNNEMGFGGGITVNIYGDVTGEEVVQKVERGLTQRLARSGALFDGAVKG